MCHSLYGGFYFTISASFRPLHARGGHRAASTAKDRERPDTEHRRKEKAVKAGVIGPRFHSLCLWTYAACCGVIISSQPAIGTCREDRSGCYQSQISEMQVSLYVLPGLTFSMMM